MGDRIALYILIVIGAVAFQAYRDGNFGDWLRAKFWNEAEPAGPGMGWASSLGRRTDTSTSSRATLGRVLTGGTDSGASPTSATIPLSLGVGGGQIVQVPGITGGVDRSIADRVRAMIAAAAADGVTLTGGGHRTTAQQAEARRRNGCPDLTSPSSTCRIPTAPVGHSQHERGLAIDFDNASTRSTAVYRWLAAHAARYGLYNLPSEAWHWSTTGS
jgi:hypothetical protein